MSNCPNCGHYVSGTRTLGASDVFNRRFCCSDCKKEYYSTRPIQNLAGYVLCALLISAFAFGFLRTKFPELDKTVEKLANMTHQVPVSKHDAEAAPKKPIDSKPMTNISEPESPAPPPTRDNYSAPITPSVVVPKRMTSLEDVPLPCTLIVTEELSLLDFSGKETLIKPNTLIKVISRKKLGTLETEIRGSKFVGNEARLAGKVKIQ